ncbi:MAG: LacI family DNA-binding transcriptional regulator [Tropicimonas sp.]|uniref:LacI family DNA-binding transcriptional regulator n=1 Tax=Tropicimonas sp. TaxID=2067044 RepID=UPI003A85E0B6
MREPSRRPTIRELAALADTSISTVSLVLNGNWEQNRIAPATADRVRSIAREIGYKPNKQARALRLSRTSLAGMIVPHYRNRFFAGLIENFEVESRARNLVPIIASTQRDPAIEEQTAATLIDQQVEVLVIVGVRDPSGINALCARHGIRCVNLDLPGPGAFSVVTDNRGGARALTGKVLDGLPTDARIVFLGGREDEYATDLRVAGFFDTLEAQGRDRSRARIIRSGFAPRAAREAIEGLSAGEGGFPDALVVNSITAFEGFATYWRANRGALSQLRLGCFDWDPFAACLPLTRALLRQDVEGLSRACFDWYDAGEARLGEVVMISPQVVSEEVPA